MLLTSLRELDVSSNGLISLPDLLPEQLVNLTALDVCHNKLESLPASLGKLTQLRTIKAADNRLLEIPTSLMQLVTYCNLIVQFVSLESSDVTGDSRQ